MAKRDNPMPKLKKLVETRLRELLDASRAELSADDANREHSDVCDNLWDVYIGGEVEEELTSAGLEQGTPAAERVYEAVHDHYLACFDEVAPQLLPKPKQAAGKQAEAQRQQLLRDAAYGEWKKVRDAIKAGADVNTTDGSGETLLFAACRSDSKATALRESKWLLENGADPRIAEADGYTPLHRAVFYCVELAQLFVEHGAEVDACAKDGMTPLAKASDEATARFLLERGAKITPAVTFCTVESFCEATSKKEAADAVAKMKLLIERGADVNAPFKRQRPLKVANKATSKAMAELLEAHGGRA